jgi:hypothetical protein
MTCPTCGNILNPDARFCPRCGAHTVAAPPPPVAGYGVPPLYPYNRVARNIQTLGTLWLVYAGLRALTGLVGVMFLHGIFGSHFGNDSFNLGWSPFGRMWMDSLWPMALFSLMISVGCVLLTGYALLTRQPWGRVFAIIFGIFALIHLPLGTALGIYTLWVLAPRTSGDEYATIAYAQHGA